MVYTTREEIIFSTRVFPVLERQKSQKMAFNFVQLSKTLGNWTVGQINDSYREQPEHLFTWLIMKITSDSSLLQTLFYIFSFPENGQ